MINPEFKPCLEHRDPEQLSGGRFAVIIEEHLNGYLISEVPHDYDRVHMKGVIALNIEDAIEQACMILEHLIRDRFQVPVPLPTGLGGRIIDEDEPDPMVNQAQSTLPRVAAGRQRAKVARPESNQAMRFANGKTYLVVEGPYVKE